MWICLKTGILCFGKANLLKTMSCAVRRALERDIKKFGALRLVGVIESEIQTIKLFSQWLPQTCVAPLKAFAILTRARYRASSVSQKRAEIDFEFGP